MPASKNRRRLPALNVKVIYTLLSALIIILGALVAIEYAKGNYRVTRQGLLRESGLLNLNSLPTAAEVYIDGELITVTDDTLYLPPAQYYVEIIKDGFWPWRKEMLVEQSLVSQTNARLFPVAPSLVPLTFSGVDRVTPSPDGQKILYVTTTASTDSRNGLFVLELTDNFLSLQRGPRQLAELPSIIDLTTAHFVWSPDSSQVLVIAPERELLVETDRKQNLDLMLNIAGQRRQILSEWEEEIYLRERQFLLEFPAEVIEMATASATNAYISPDKKRLLYTAAAEFELAPGLVPPVPAANSQEEARAIQPGEVYIYDREEDRNFRIMSEREDLENPKLLLADDLYRRNPLTLIASPSAFTRLQATSSAQTAENFNRYYTALYLDTLQWYPDSRHVIYTTDNAIRILGYDNTNDTTIYSGPYAQEFVYPWPDGSKVLILTTFSPETPLNLYAIELR